ncbi:Divalent-cation tolerance protein CutA [Sulfidibacter corallicola]|uniref:Divalent-cation tolerance protein CutA n=1 Tax=Sulfidibacter corallicola TaxID=2818388 RepID=A0A8A4TRG6_SULCO|nr:divalent-cation tolerance protein CutA [Sulfidibacter corallicola]QTD51608.1 divalent-cation tolerance protein CutA [Sulfidibacter corallicola]
MSRHQEFRWIYITCSDKAEARHIARTLLEERLVACANIFDAITSMYWWEGEIQEDQEAVVIAKSRADRFTDVKDRVRDLHSYSVPCVIALPIQEGNPDYLSWLVKETGAARD